MGPIQLNALEINWLENNYPLLHFDKKRNRIQGTIEFNLCYEGTGKRINDHYQIEIDLNHRANGGILPVVRETTGKILKIAQRKMMNPIDLHINEKNGELCLIIPMKESERYPQGFSLIEILEHLKQHLYWVSYRDRYDVEPWQGQGHGYNGMIELYLENKDKYAGKIKKHIEKEMDRKISKKEFHRIMKYLIHKSKM